MEKNKFDELLKQIDEQAFLVKYDFQIAESFNRLLDENAENLTSEQKQQIQWEILLYRLMTKNRFASDGLITERFVPVAKYTDGSIFPDPNSFNHPALDYFEGRAITSKNSILKARYFDFLWEKSKSKKKHLYAIEAIEQYILNVDAYRHEDAIIERLDGLQRATELCLILEGKKSNK